MDKKHILYLSPFELCDKIWYVPTYSLFNGGAININTDCGYASFSGDDILPFQTNQWYLPTRGAYV